MIIDFHVHLLPRRVRQDRGKFFHMEPAFETLYSSPKSKLASEEQIIDYMDENKIDKSVVFGFPWITNGLVEQNNDEVWNFHQRFPDRIIPFAVLGAGMGEDTPGEASARLNNGFKGLGELAMYGAGWGRETLESLGPALEIAQQADRPVLIHVNEPVGHDYPGKIRVDFQGLVDLISGFPDLRFVLGHMGGGLFIYTLMPEVADILRNTYLDTAAVPFLYKAQVYRTATDLMGEEKVLFGSDFPLMGLPRLRSHLERGGLDEKTTEMILGGNAEKLLR
jgi:hypothetical protein